MKCLICHRGLTAQESVRRSVGPECWTKYTNYLATCGTSERELAELEEANEEAAKWIANFHQDVYAQRTTRARQCLEIARQKAGFSKPAAKPNEIVIVQTPRGYRVNFPYKPSDKAIRGFHGIGMTWQGTGTNVYWSIPANRLSDALDFIGYWYTANPIPGQPHYGVRVQEEQAVAA